MGFSRSLAAGQVSRIQVFDVRSGTSRVVHVDHAVLLEAPNWTSTGDLVLNGDGLLWRMPADGSTPPSIVLLEGLPELNNDHVLSPDRATVYMSANDGHLYAAPVGGGAVRRVTAPAAHWHFLHGVSPDGERLAYVALDPEDGWDSGTLHIVGVDGAGDRAVTAGRGPDDGPEFDPTGEWVYFNTERFSATPGHAQIARIRPDGTGLEQLTFDDRVNWFPHLDPTGRFAVYLSFPPGTTGHPADREVRLHLVDGAADADAWEDATVAVELDGGQGTINVNSWSPDGTRFAFVDYPVG
ncbi:biopolymer transporter Tol [uncultured Microbacterium sp.]|uniref:Periplasmic component of the Tol biopolymer transport system n=1 Tax=uncultured Microbacterium sp. TaxID=191216 RepID=A0A1Y5P0A7_9MICO|nr:biopolymer transporter Tol [uncultured Microbacterium sp.]SBS72107.1 conserved hypothetical protein [uncultured Microbacterium sp.]